MTTTPGPNDRAYLVRYQTPPTYVPGEDGWQKWWTMKDTMTLGDATDVANKLEKDGFDVQVLLVVDARVRCEMPGGTT